MVTQFNIRFSISAAFRILTAKLAPFGKLATVERLFRVRGNLFNAVYRIRFGNKLYRWATFMSASEFEAHFIQRRKEDAKKLLVTPSECGDFTEVYNPDKGTSYQVFHFTDKLSCSCEDYCNQVKFKIPNPTCKHGYAALMFMGYGDLEDYIAETNWEIARDEAAWELGRIEDARACLGF